MHFHPFFGFGGAVHVDDLLPGDPLREHGQETGDLFTFLVETLRDPNGFPNPEINRLLNLTWWLVNQKVLQTALTPGIHTMHFGCNAACTQGMFAIPYDWTTQCIIDRIFCTGGLVWAASQARDFHNKRMAQQDNTVIQRARAYEAEYYLTVRSENWFRPSDYQRAILAAYPEGLASAKHLLYPLKDFRGKAS